MSYFTKFYFREYLEVASRGFTHIDLIGQHFMCYLLGRTSKLQLIRMERGNDNIIFRKVNSIPAKDAICLEVRFSKWFSTQNTI